MRCIKLRQVKRWNKERGKYEKENFYGGDIGHQLNNPIISIELPMLHEARPMPSRSRRQGCYLREWKMRKNTVMCAIGDAPNGPLEHQSLEEVIPILFQCSVSDVLKNVIF